MITRFSVADDDFRPSSPTGKTGFVAALNGFFGNA
jgi:hypothetical protein